MISHIHGGIVLYIMAVLIIHGIVNNGKTFKCSFEAWPQKKYFKQLPTTHPLGYYPPHK